MAIAYAGCQSAWQPLFRSGEETKYTQEQLRADLVSLANSYELQISAAADKISRSTTETHYREDALLWQMIVLPRVRRLAFLPDPRQGYLAMLVVSAGLRDYFEQGEGKDLFGEYQSIAIDTSRALETEAYSVGTRFLTEEQLREVREEVAAIVEKSPVRGTFSPESFVSAVQQTTSDDDNIGWVVKLPMVPVRALTGVSEGAQAIHEFTDASRYLSDVAASLPQMMRWQTELLVYDLERRDSVLAGLSGWEELADSSQRLAEAAERLPEDMRIQTADLIDQLQKQQEDLRRTLTEARSAIADVDRALLSARQLAEPFAALAGQVQLAGASWTDAMREVRAMQGNGSAASPTKEKKEFDIREYEATAREVTVAAAEIRDLVLELHRLVESPQLSTAINGLTAGVGRAEASSQALINLVAWRLFQLVVFFFLALLGYRTVAVRLTRSRT